MEREFFITQIRIAGNTAAPCFVAIKQKGYVVEAYVDKISDDEYLWTWDAIKDKRRFSATSPEELLGLISMWEVRGDEWNISDNEYRDYESIKENAVVYDGVNVLEDE